MSADALTAPISEGSPVGSCAHQVIDVLATRPNASSSPWLVVIPEGHPAMRRVHESLTTVGDGVMGTRGSLEEDGADSLPAVFMAGVYDGANDGSESFLAVPSWTTLTLNGTLPAGSRVLDLRTGVFWRAAEAEDGVVLSSARWACPARPGTVVLVVEGRSGVLGVNGGREQISSRAKSGAGVAAILDTASSALPLRGGRPPTIGVVRIGSYMSAVGGVPDDGVLEARQSEAVRMGAPGLLAEQEVAWAARWAHADVEVMGDPGLTRAVRFALFHLMSSVADHDEAAVGARGLTGPAYGGHVFWDADVFVLPVMAAVRPAAARAMLEYRIRRLPAAADRACADGWSGARFPWESASEGNDVTPKSGIDVHGEVVAIRTGELEEHITADVAWAAWQLAAWSGDWSFLEGAGRPLLTETARYWATRVRLDSAGVGHIDGVIGPDEYHEDVDDNAFTNQMAAWNLARATDLVERSGSRRERAEAKHWRRLSAALADGYDPSTGRHMQFAGFENLEPLVVSDVGPVPVAADVALGQARVAGSQIIKQADVLMAHHMIPGAQRTGTFQRDLDYYLPRTAHGSSLSPAVHAGLLARAGRLDEALALLEVAQGIDLDDVTGTSAGGLHLAALAGLWQALVVGFAGLRVSDPDDDALVLDPHIPPGWGELCIRLEWHGQPLRLRCRNDAVHVENKSNVRVQLGSDAPVCVWPPGRWVEVAVLGNGPRDTDWGSFDDRSENPAE